MANRTKSGAGVEPPRIPVGLAPAQLESEVTLEEALATGVDLSGERIEDLEAKESRFERCLFTGATLDSLSLQDCELVDCELSGAFIKSIKAYRVSFTRCRMSGTVMSGAALRHVSFVDCHMDGVNLRMTEGKWR